MKRVVEHRAGGVARRRPVGLPVALTAVLLAAAAAAPAQLDYEDAVSPGIARPISPQPPPHTDAGDIVIMKDGQFSGLDVEFGPPAAVIPAASANGIPETVRSAYQHATDVLSVRSPACKLPMTLLAAIGKVESGHARGGWVDGRGTTVRPIFGPALDGRGGLAMIADTDGGRLDRDPLWDRAVGPMQFIPQTWRSWAVDGNADGRADPHNVFDASLAAARYLCANGRDLSTSAGLEAAILNYNNSASYLDVVLAWMKAYAGSTVAIPDATSGPPGRNVYAAGKPAAQAGNATAPAAQAAAAAPPVQSPTPSELDLPATHAPAAPPPPQSPAQPVSSLAPPEHAPTEPAVQAASLNDSLVPDIGRPLAGLPCAPLLPPEDPAVLARTSESPTWRDDLTQCAAAILDMVQAVDPIRPPRPDDVIHALIGIEAAHRHRGVESGSGLERPSASRQ